MKFLYKKLPFIDYLYTLTDDVGIFQHSIYGVPDPHKGYTTDDNARALILAVMLCERFKNKNYLYLVYKYLGFMLNAQNEDGVFKNFMNYDRNFIKEDASEDCFGRCMWALGRTIASPAIPMNIKRTCRQMLKKVLVKWPKLRSPRAKALAVVGLCYLDETEGNICLIDTLSSSLVEQYTKFKDGDWHWFEDSVTYGNAILPWSLLKAYGILKKDILLDAAKESTAFLSKITLDGAFFKPVGCNGWYFKGKKSAEYDEQPLEACEMTLLYLEFYSMTKEKRYLDNAIKCFRWYTGLNSKSLSLIDMETGACYDGLSENGLNYNQGSENIVSYGISFMEISKKLKH